MVSEDEDRGNNIIITVFLLYFHLEDKSGRGKERENEKLNPYVIIHFPQQVGWKKKRSVILLLAQYIFGVFLEQKDLLS